MRLSYSTNNLVDLCPRKYQIIKLQGEGSDASNENNEHLDYGKALGEGLQCLMYTKDRDLAIVTALAAYHWNETDNKCMESMVLAIMTYELSDDWEVAILDNGKPALELSFKIELGEGDYYCGFMDAVMINRYTNKPGVFEVKTTGSMLNDLSPMYKNSPQGVGYSIVLSAIVPSADFSIHYPVVQLKRTWKPKIKVYEFEKTLKDRLEWLIDLKIQYDQLCTYRDMDYYPKKGQSCLDFNRPCHLFGICDLSAYTESPDYVEQKEEIEWDYVFNLEELIELTQQQLLGDTT